MNRINEQWVEQQVQDKFFYPCFYCTHLEWVTYHDKLYVLCCIDAKSHFKRAHKLKRCPLNKFMLSNEYLILNGRLVSKHSLSIMDRPEFEPMPVKNEEKERRRAFLRRAIDERRQRFLSERCTVCSLRKWEHIVKLKEGSTLKLCDKCYHIWSIPGS